MLFVIASLISVNCFGQTKTFSELKVAEENLKQGMEERRKAKRKFDYEWDLYISGLRKIVFDAKWGNG